MPRLSNLKRETFAQKYARGLVQNRVAFSATAVYTEVYHCQPNSARASAARLLADVSVRERVYELVSSHNAPEELAADLEKLRRAKRGIYFKGKRVAEEPDNTARLQAVGLSLKAQEVFLQANQLIGDADSPSFRLTPEMIERLEKIVPMLSDLNKRVACPKCGFGSSAAIHRTPNQLELLDGEPRD